MFVDSHCHLNYLADPLPALDRAREAGVERMLCIGVDQTHIEEVLSYTSHEGVWATVGEHPGSVSGDIEWIAPLLSRDKVVAVGETGLDYHYEEREEERVRQRASFEAQMDVAGRASLPVVIHSRGAEADTLAVIDNHPRVRGVLHCFTESWALAERALQAGYYVSISGIVTFKNAANVRQVAARIPDERLLIETDAPWLAPVPHRGRKNEPAYVTETARSLAHLRGVDVGELAALTTANFFSLFERAAEPQPPS